MNRLLLDTQVIIWWDRGSRSLGKKAAAVIAGADVVYVSAASEWELSIKSAIGKIRLHRTVLEATLESGFDPLPISFEHARAIQRLAPIHRDPFDRIIVASAVVEGLTLVTADSELRRYPADILPALD